LTLISKAVATLPLTVSANTGFVGIRCPSHPIAQALLREANVPIAAPSANRFGHVSPTSAQHVMDDLGQNEISIIDDTNETTCQVGIESTVIKIVPEEKKLILFRRGGISEKALFNFLKEKKTLFDGLFSIQIIDKKQAKKKEEQEPQQAPGQLLTHYAPDVDTYLYQSNSSSSSSLFFLEEDKDKLVILDFHGRLFHLKKKVLAYQDLSISGDIIEASKKIFDFLRWAENIQGVERILLTDVLDVDHEHTNALHDRMYRAASGKVL
jgi:hypothetical protein